MRKVIKSFWLATVVSLVSLALVVSLARLALPSISEYKQDIEALLEEGLGHSLSIGDIKARMNGLYPSLHLLNVSMLDEANSEPLLFFNEVYVDVDLVSSIINWRPEFGSLTLVGLDLAVERTAEGAIVVAGVKGEAKGRSPGDLERGVEWFLNKQHLLIENTTVRWADRLNDLPEQVFSGLDFTLVNVNGKHQFIGEGFLPGRLGQRFNFVFNLDSVGGHEGWGGDGYLHAAGAELAPWHTWLFSQAPGYRLDGRIDTDIWLSWSQGALRSIDAQIHARDLELDAPDVAVMQYDDLQFVSHWRAEAGGWALGIDGFRLQQGEAFWTPGYAAVRYRLHEEQRRYEIGLEQLDASWLNGFALRLPFLKDEVKDVLAAVKPQARIDDFYLRWQGKEKTSDDVFMRAQVSDASFSHYKKVPGVTGVDGKVYFDKQGWMFDFSTEDASIDFVGSGLFREPLKLATLAGSIQGTFAKEGWDVWTDHLSFSNEHLSASAYLSVLKNRQEGESPILDLVVSVDEADGRYTSHYLPVGIMHERLVQWLDRSIVDAKVKSAGVVFRGPLKSFPFDSNQGRFEVQVEIEEGVLSYMPGWPPIVDIDGRLIFNEQSMEVVGRSAMTLDSRLSDVRVSIPKFKSKKRALYIKGHAKGPSSNGLLFLTTTPLVKTIGQPFTQAKAKGQSALDLTLRIPLNRHESTVTVDGRVSLSESDLNFENLDLDISGVDGVLSFSEKAVSAERLVGQVMGFGVEAKLSTESKGDVRQIVVEARGEASPSALLERFHVPVFKNLQQDVPWQGRLLLPFSGEPSLQIQSTMQGVAVNIPAPIGKKASEERNLQLALQFPLNSDNPLRLRYGDQLSGVFEFESDAKGLSFQRGEIRFGDGEAFLPRGKGLRLVGRMPFYDHSLWMGYVAGLQGDGGAEEAPVLLTELNFYFDEALLFGQKTKNVFLELVEVDKTYLGEVFSSEVAGHFVIPKRSNEPITLDLDYLFYHSESVVEKMAEQPSPDPREITSVHLDVKSFFRDNASLGRLIVDLQPDEGRGVNISRLDLQGRFVDMQLTGSWWVNEKSEQRSMLKGAVKSDNMGRLLGLLGFVDNLKSGKAKNHLNLRWEGGLADFALDKLQGDVEFNIKSGTLLDVDPGAGRIFGLLSIQALPRRLSLDFSDMFAKGLAFDAVEGRVELNQGEAFTEALTLTGPSVDISITGYIDLVGKKYNQYVTVEPNFAGTLPLAVAVIANPAAGVAAWFAEKLLKRPVSDIAKILYHVTGSWQEPEIKRLGRIENYQQQE